MGLDTVLKKLKTVTALNYINVIECSNITRLLHTSDSDEISVSWL